MGVKAAPGENRTSLTVPLLSKHITAGLEILIKFVNELPKKQNLGEIFNQIFFFFEEAFVKYQLK